MVQIAGTYVLVSQENYKEYYVSLGVSEAEAETFSKSLAKIIISDVGPDKVTVAYSSRTTTYPLNKEYEHVVIGDQKVWTTVTLQDDGLIAKSKLNEDGSLSEEKVYKITDSGLTSISTNSRGVKAVGQYDRT